MNEKASDNGGTPVRPVSESVLRSIDEQVEAAGGEWEEGEEYKGSVGRSMYDLPNSKDNSITVLLPRDNLEALPSQALARIKSVEDKRNYIAMVIEGPFAEPDGLRGDAPILVNTTVRGGLFIPRYHGRVNVEILGEELLDGTMVPPRFRPLPNSPVFALDPKETAAIIQAMGDIRLGRAVGHEELLVGIPSRRKSVLPRHEVMLGTTGAGKSTTVSGQIAGMAKAGLATIVVDTEGEYTTLNEPTTDARMLAALKARGLAPEGVAKTTVYHLVGRETANPGHPKIVPFSLNFSRLSPYAVMEILELNDAQQERFLKAYDLAKRLIAKLGRFPKNDADRKRQVEIDELEEGYPELSLELLYDTVQYIAAKVAKAADARLECLETRAEADRKKIEAELEGDLKNTSHPASWWAIQGKLGRLRRLGIFDSDKAKSLDYSTLLESGSVSIFDLSDSDSPYLNNLVIADLLRGVQTAQEKGFAQATKYGHSVTPVEIVIEEAHEFLSAQRIAKMPVLFQQVARIARRGRKRWLGLIFVTQLSQHLPDEVFGLCNNFVLHKINDPNVVARLKRTIGGIDEGLWGRLPNLAPGQAIVSFAHMARPLLVAIDPTPCRLRMVE